MKLGYNSGKEIVMVEYVPSPSSYKERLLGAAVVNGYDDFVLENIEEIDLSKDKWYKKAKEDKTHE